jgi:hypothetical protein
MPVHAVRADRQRTVTENRRRIRSEPQTQLDRGILRHDSRIIGLRDESVGHEQRYNLRDR